MAAKRITELVDAVVTTSDATVTTLLSYTTTSGECGACVVLVIGRDGAGNRAAFERFVGYQNVSGTLTVGTTVSLATDQAAALVTTAITLDASGTSFRVRVTGVVATTIDWFCEVRILRC